MPDLEISTDKIAEALGNPNTDPTMFDDLKRRYEVIKSLQQ